MKRAINEKEAWDLQETYKDVPHGWIQWKGTDVCMDVYCQCGESTHIDDEFVYTLTCVKCGQSYMVSGHVELIALEETPECAKITHGEE